MSDQVFAKKYENKEMTKKGQKQRQKQNAITNRAKDTQKFHIDIFTSSIFFFQEESKNKKRQGGPPR